MHSLESLKSAIRRSLARSAQYGVDPHSDGAPEATKLTDRELEDRIQAQFEYYSLAREQLDTLYRLLRGTGFCMALADRDGYVVYVTGDPDLVEHFKRRRCIPGYRWTERDIGTCAIGLALEERIPVFLPGDKMYSAQAKTISNAGAPVFSPDGGVLGVISLSGKSDRMHIHTLGLVRQAAETVTAQLRERERIRELVIKNQYMISLLESDSRGIVTVDQKGRIVHTNGKARALLKLPENHEGMPFENCVEGLFNPERLLRGKGFRAREVATSCGNLFASLDPIRLPTGELVGGLFTLLDKKEIVRMAIAVTGVRAHFTFASIIGDSEPLQEACRLARISAGSTAPILISGETGTGKELFAQAIHNESNRRHRPFVTINCGAIPKELLESELFGYEEGAFTGAQKGGRTGKLELADTGTLFLDEIGDMPFDMQVKLLRVLQMGEIQRVGGLRVVTVDLRIISATNKNLQKAIAEHKFRADLYYRISTLNIVVPPLRERTGDILPLLRFFLSRQEQLLGKTLGDLPPQTVDALLGYHWPGNVRQLESAVECAAHMAQGAELLPEHFGIADLRGTTATHMGHGSHTSPGLDDMEKGLIIEQLARHKGNIARTAQAIGISRPTLYRKLRKYGIGQ